LLQEFDSKEGVRIFTDIDELDRLTGGFRAGELVLFTAETGVGKTLLAQQTRRRSCRDGRHTLFCSGEMRAQHLISREIATEAGVEHWKMRRPERMPDADRSSLVEAASHECAQCRILDGELSMTRIRKVARQMKSQSGLDLIIVDYDELVEAPGETEFDQQRYIVRDGKSIAIALKIPVIVISQLRKSLQGEDRKRPTLQRLYGSGAKAKHSSIVLYVDRPYVQELAGDETEARIVIAKNRDGKVGAIDARFNVKTLRFESLPKPQPEQPDWVNR
jgi:replicative DNA helicase